MSEDQPPPGAGTGPGTGPGAGAGPGPAGGAGPGPVGGAGHGPAGGAGHRPDTGAGHGPETGAGPGPGRELGRAPGRGPTGGAGQPPGTGAGHGPETGAGQPPGTGAGHGPETGAGQPPGTGAGHGPETGAGQPPGTGAGHGPETGAGQPPGTGAGHGPETGAGQPPGAAGRAGPYGGQWEVPWAESFAATDPERAELAATFAAAIRRTGSLMQLMSQAAADRIGINSTDLNCLNILSFRGQMTAGDLARETGLTTASITGVVDRLEEAGYVRRERDPQDRRRVVVRIVLDRALRDVAAVFLPMVRDWNEMAGRYSDDELRLIVGFYDRMEEVLRGHLNRLRERPAARKPS